MLPELIRESKIIDFFGKNITIKKMMTEDSIKLSSSKNVDDLKSFFSTLVDINIEKLTNAELYRLMIEINEFTNNTGVQLNITCNNKGCILKTPFTVEIMSDKIEWNVYKKQDITIDNIVFNIENKFNPGKNNTIGDMLTSVVYNGKIYTFENKDEKETFLHKYITMDQYNRFVSGIKLESGTFTFKCPLCKKEYKNDILELDFFQSLDQ